SLILDRQPRDGSYVGVGTNDLGVPMLWAMPAIWLSIPPINGPSRPNASEFFGRCLVQRPSWFSFQGGDERLAMAIASSATFHAHKHRSPTTGTLDCSLPLLTTRLLLLVQLQPHPCFLALPLEELHILQHRFLPFHGLLELATLGAAGSEGCNSSAVF